MEQDAVTPDMTPDRRLPRLGAEIQKRLGQVLRAFYEKTTDGLPLPADQIQLLLHLRHRERELQRTR
ncbi:hypothetical protein M446_6693 [Methylobacterium sp. 4-46]|uniref:hypothetical protein n=1 Tax=unclassified Methylobacterium TaxID=2615210 RepID=UPI000152D4BD|nr:MULTISPECIES: hypothetical protein [Methylobacterium]ACA20944.1 hypothetical protein M446_6693 [Methylobacterium sp. 4-46]WFT80099.1 hypothetical protein QA634_33805 [Methylobacterium nodulans]